MSASDRVKSKTSAFSAIRSRRVDLGMTGDAHRSGQAALHGLLHAGPGVQRAALRPVHEVQVDLVHPEPLEAVLKLGYRVLGVREGLSLSTDNTTSPERQFDAIRRFAVYKEHDLVPITEADYDLDVSGAVSPFDRPGLGRWLKEDRLDQWDAICAAKLDRISRSLFDFTHLVHWLEAHGKSLIILDPELDLTTKEGRAMANVLMTFAEYEREVIGARVKDAYDKLIRDGRYTGGGIPFGYRPVKLDKNWGYEIDPVYGPIVQEIADRFLRYETLGSIVRWLNETGTPCPRDVVRLRSTNPKTRAAAGASKARWTTGIVRKILLSKAILGAITNTHGEVLRDEQGMVIYRAAPLLADDPGEARDKYERIQARLAQNKSPARVNSSLLSGMISCGECGGYMYRNNSATVHRGKKYYYGYYRCEDGRLANGKCSSTYNYQGDPLEDAVSSTLLSLVGHRKLRTERLVPGRDYSEESARLIEQTQHLMAEIGRARLARKDYSELQATLDAANAELDRLATLEPVPARLEYDDTDQTFRDWWELNDLTARNAFLREHGIRVVVHRDRLPPIEYEDGPLTALDITRMAIIDRPGMHIVIYLGNLGDLLKRANDLSITISQT
jgi:DNA invertase Pin-like site-specific DNA recombinase